MSIHNEEIKKEIIEMPEEYIDKWKQTIYQKTDRTTLLKLILVSWSVYEVQIRISHKYVINLTTGAALRLLLTTQQRRHIRG